MLIDAHAHPSMEALDQAILEGWAGHRLVAAATNLENWQELCQLQNSFPHLSTTIGIHPWKVRQDSQAVEMEQIASILHQEAIAIGEVGLDFSRPYRTLIPQQLNMFEFFIQLGLSLNRPMVIHIVKAHHVFLSLYKKCPNLRVYLHRYSGNSKMIADYQRYRVFYGVCVTETQHLSKRGIPVSRILLESDGLVSVHKFEQALSEVAKYYKLSMEQMADQLQENIEQMYAID